MRDALVIVILWLGSAAFLWSYDPGSPLVPFGGDDYVSSPTVKAGDRITVFRSFVVERKALVHINRVMVKAGCPKNCEVVDLAHGSLILDPGTYRKLPRDHVIPSHTKPGRWALVFTVSYTNLVGRSLSATLPRLEIEVIP